MHPSGLHPEVVKKVLARRGRLHAFETLDPARTALVVIDMTEAAVVGNPKCGELVQPINRLAGALRSAGGCVAWVSTRFDRTSIANAVFGNETAERFERDCNGAAGALCSEFDVASEDVIARKTGMSAFFPGKCDLHDQLKAMSIESLLIAGTLTNVCCYSSATDACELGYRVTLISDACTGHLQGQHDAALTTFYRAFGDVRPVDDLVNLIVSDNGV